MTDINVTGIQGTPGQAGTDGGLGGDADAQNTGNGIDTSNTAEATGGAGGVGGNYLGTLNPGAGGNGGNATASTSTTLNSAAGITSTATATGGGGGNGGIAGYTDGANGGDGGTATASAAAANGTGVARATATATGGYGGFSHDPRGGVGGGAGGIASNTTASASGFSAYATATQTGGAGGGSHYGLGGAGANSTLTNAVSGTTTGGTLGLYQTATGGRGGDNGFYGASGYGGTATSSLTFNDVTANTTHASTLKGYSTATGGAGGNVDHDGGYSPGKMAGGAATAAIALTGANVVNATATAGGGAGGQAHALIGVSGIAAASSSATSIGTAPTSTATADSTATGGGSGATQGSANAHATATTANGQLATATTTATGATGSDDSTAVTQGSGVVTTVSAFAQAPVASTATTLAESNSGNQLGLSGFNGTNNNSYAFATEVPNSSLVTSILNANSNLETALGNGTVFGLGTEGASYSTTASGSRTYTDTIAWTLNTTGLSGDLIAGLINDQSFGSGFDSLDFNVVENGTTIFDKTFTTLSAAQAFFTNDALDLGTLPSGPNQVIDFNFSLTTSGSGTGFGAQFLLGTTPTVTPQLAGQVNLTAATEGAALPAATTVATFTDTNTSDTASNFTATIDWGDGTTTSGTVVGSNGAFTVTGGHTYTDEGSFPLGVAITDASNSTSLPLSGTVSAAEADVLTAQGLTFTANPGQAFSGTVATFTDSYTGNLASDFTATINWGDGTTTAGVITDTAGTISVSGTHTYASSGQNAVSVTLSDAAPGTATATANSTANVAGLAGQVRLSAATEGRALPSTTTVATFTDSNTSDRASTFRATIKWGDGTTTTGVVSGSNGTFTVTGGHTYADEGSFLLGVTITDTANNTSLSLGGTVAAAEGDVLNAHALSLRATAGQAFTGAVATFTDSYTGNLASDFSATINWGDGTTTAGVITDSRGVISVSGTHTYASSGQDAVTVTLTDGAPGTATAAAHSTATVASPGGRAGSGGPGGRFAGVASEITPGGTTSLGHSANGTDSSGALIASDGLHTQSLALLSQYMVSSFVTASDGHDSSPITIPPPDQHSLLSHPHA